MASGAGRTRNFATVVYPESAPENWFSLLGELKVPCFVSPLHDKDLNPNGEVKKSHYHVLFAFDGVKTLYYQTLYNKLIFNFSCKIKEVPA